ncbi:MAG TPA: hypothetical protein VF595_08255 [Tepidisphaeraceae bacterium]
MNTWTLLLTVLCLLSVTTASALAQPAGATTQPLARLPYTVPDAKRVRVIISTDAANEIDDQYAIVHALLTPQLIIKGIVSAHFGVGTRPCDDGVLPYFSVTLNTNAVGPSFGFLAIGSTVSASAFCA